MFLDDLIDEVRHTTLANALIIVGVFTVPHLTLALVIAWYLCKLLYYLLRQLHKIPLRVGLPIAAFIGWLAAATNGFQHWAWN
jgi:hypothetical protein